MKITAVYNRAGRILAAAIVDGDGGGPIPLASKGTKAGTFEVPLASRELGLVKLCSSHRIDARASRLVEMKQSGKKATKKKKSRGKED